MDTVEKGIENLCDEHCFLFGASVLRAKIVFVLTSAYKREEEAQLKYADFQERAIEILNWIDRFALNNNAMRQVQEFISFKILRV